MKQDCTHILACVADGMHTLWPHSLWHDDNVKYACSCAAGLIYHEITVCHMRYPVHTCSANEVMKLLLLTFTTPRETTAPPRP